MRRFISTSLRRAAQTTRSYLSDTRGAFAVIFALMAMVLVAFGGAAVDYTLWQNAQTSARNAADAGALAGAISSSEDLATIRKIVTGAASPTSMFATLEVGPVTYDSVKDQVGVTVAGTYETLFVTLVGVHTMPVKAFATSERAQPGELEIALVLDNTFSMSVAEPAGSITKIAALKTASLSLVEALWKQDTAGAIKVALVPYADYVNVGLESRSQPWLSVVPDNTTSTPNACRQTASSQKYDCKYAPKYACTTVVDGVTIPATCGGAEIAGSCKTRQLTPETICPPPTIRTYKWYGCVDSRKAGTLRLNDTLPNTPYIGPVVEAGKRACLNPIVPLTKDHALIRINIGAMITDIANINYKPQTYIPAGVIWGVNVLSPTAPFKEGALYDPAKLRPRKAMVLMTDGNNTLQFATSGKHTEISKTAPASISQKAKADADTQALCTYAKDQGIEIFTVVIWLVSA